MRKLLIAALAVSSLMLAGCGYSSCGSCAPCAKPVKVKTCKTCAPKVRTCNTCVGGIVAAPAGATVTVEVPAAE